MSTACINGDVLLRCVSRNLVTGFGLGGMCMKGFVSVLARRISERKSSRNRSMPHVPYREVTNLIHGALAEVIRATKIIWLRHASVTSLLTDVREGYTMLCFRCDQDTSS